MGTETQIEAVLSRLTDGMAAISPFHIERINNPERITMPALIQMYEAVETFVDAHGISQPVERLIELADQTPDPNSKFFYQQLAVLIAALGEKL